MRIAMTVLWVAGLTTTLMADETVRGVYAESRSCAVLAGACHYNGELDLAGRKAVMGFAFQAGERDGVSLAGVRAVLVVTADKNLKYDDAVRRSVLYVDTSASAEQRRVVTKLIVEQAGRNIGKIVATKDVPVTFNQTETGTVFEAGKAVTLSVREIPGRPCCVMPHNVWYKPLVKLDRPLVGTTVKNRVKETALNATWLRTEESSAFYGTFTLPATEKVAAATSK